MMVNIGLNMISLTGGNASVNERASSDVHLRAETWSVNERASSNMHLRAETWSVNERALDRDLPRREQIRSLSPGYHFAR